MTRHTHIYTLYKKGNVTEMICDCGANLKSIYHGAVLIEVEDGQEEQDWLDGRGTE